MKKYIMCAPLAAMLLVTTACVKADDDNGDESATTTSAEAADGAPVASGEDLSIDENLAAVADLSTFNDAVAAAGLTETLGGAGPYTVFAPTDAAFESVENAREMLDRGGAPLVNLMSYHIVPGVVAVEDLRNAIEQGGGSAEIATMSGATLTARLDGDDVVISTGAGNQARITEADKAQINGMVHVIDGVLQPVAANGGGGG